MGHRRMRGAIVATTVAVLGCVPAPASAQEGTRPEAPGSAGQSDGPKRAVAAPRAAKADIVRVGVLVNDIQQLDLQSHSYNVDMYMWFKWRDPDIDPSRSFEFLNAFELWGHILTYETDKPERLRDGSYYQVLRNQGKFNAKLPLGRYPFDTQHLLVELEDSSSDNRTLRYVPDSHPIATSKDLTLPGWRFAAPSLHVVRNRYDTDFGDPSAANPTYSRVVIDVPTSRPHGTYALKLLLPMLLVALTAALALMVHPRYVEGRIGIGITALLTLVALQLTTNSNLPEVDYLLLLDKLYILSYAFVVLTLAVIVRNSWVDASGDVPVAARADRRGLGILTVGYAVVAVLLVVLSLT
jgi:hypothetical protein